MKTTLSNISKRLMIFNAKGGVGKTAIALNFALTFGYGVVTNDPLSYIDGVLEESRRMILEKDAPLPDIPAAWPVIFDFGGYPDERALKALNMSDYVLIPVLPSRDTLQANFNFIQEVIEHKKEIIVIVNQTTGGQFEEVRRAVQIWFPDLPVFNIKKSAALGRMVESKKSVAELADFHKLYARHFHVVADQFQKIAEYILKYK